MNAFLATRKPRVADSGEKTRDFNGTPRGDGGPGRTRTSDLRFRKPLLCPAELRNRARMDLAQAPVDCSLPATARVQPLERGQDGSYGA